MFPQSILSSAFSLLWWDQSITDQCEFKNFLVMSWACIFKIIWHDFKKIDIAYFLLSSLWFGLPSCILIVLFWTMNMSKDYKCSKFFYLVKFRLFCSVIFVGSESYSLRSRFNKLLFVISFCKVLGIGRLQLRPISRVDILDLVLTLKD